MRRASMSGRVPAAVALCALTCSAAPAWAHGDPGDPPEPLLRSVVEVRRATAAFKDVNAAIAAGYAQFQDCKSEPGFGAMGTHWLNGTLAGDAVVDAHKPEALMYETQQDGSLKLVGVEYIVFQEAWDAAHPQPPTLFGHPFHLVRSPNRYDVPAFYELHFWVWRANPLGLFADWNPHVVCR